MSPADPKTQKVAIVTGASQGIGAGIAAGFRRTGYAVVGTALSIEPSDADDLLTVSGDISEPATAERIVEQALDRFGRIDALVNNAGVFIGKRFTEYTVDDLTTMLAVNLSGFFHITQPVVRQMSSQGGGHIVNITTSLVDHARSSSPSALASLAKGGLDAVTRSLAIEYAAAGIRVNAVAPGIIKTPAHDDASYEGLADVHPLRRLGEISDIVGAILYLEQATFITGETLHIDGGLVAGH
jgi:NAD(P)-dependent dehydrogenase (short-subunit alcohol dehydrogenase family)